MSNKVDIFCTETVDDDTVLNLVSDITDIFMGWYCSFEVVEGMGIMCLGKIDIDVLESLVILLKRLAVSSEAHKEIAEDFANDLFRFGRPRRHSLWNPGAANTYLSNNDVDIIKQHVAKLDGVSHDK